MLIVGLGNHDKKYIHTLHNVGFLALDFLIPQLPDKTLHLKPKTGMNLSGTEVAKTLKYYKLIATNLIVIHDDIDLPFGEIKTSFGSGSGGHKGVQNIIDTLGTKDFWRIRIGVAPEGYNPSLHKAEDFVLTDFSKAQLTILKEQLFSIVFQEISKLLL